MPENHWILATPGAGLRKLVMTAGSCPGMMSPGLAATCFMRFCARIRSGVECRRDGCMLLQVLFWVHVVAGQHNRSRRSVHAHILRGVGMPSIDIASHAANNLLRVIVDQSDHALDVQFDQVSTSSGSMPPWLFAAAMPLPASIATLSRSIRKLWERGPCHRRAPSACG